MKAFLCGVRRYVSLSNMPGSKTDLENIYNAIVQRLNIHISDVQLLGLKQEYVEKSKFVQRFMEFTGSISEDETVIFYFSGHGSNNSYGRHEIHFSDDSIETEQIIQLLENSRSKNNIVILDCCFAGNVSIESKALDLESNLSKIIGTGTEVFCSCKSDELSYEYENTGGFFTNVFSKTLDTIQGNEQKGLTVRDLTSYLRRFFEIGLKNVRYKQTFVQLGNSIGDIYLIEPQPEKYYPKDVFFESDDFVLEEVRPLHSGYNKRYSVMIRLKSSLSNVQIKRVADEILSLSESFEVYQNNHQQQKLINRSVSHIFCYFGYTDEDMLNKNYYCRSVWVNRFQDKKHWLKPGKSSEMIEDTLLIYNTQYLTLKKFIEQNTESDSDVFIVAKAIKADSIKIGEKIINKYKSYQNKEIVESELIDFINSYSIQIAKLVDRSLNLSYTTQKLKPWIEKIIGLTGTLNDFILFYGKDFLEKRDKTNRIQCMDSSIKMFREDLNELAIIESGLTEFFNYDII
jgi:Caspase domain